MYQIDVIYIKKSKTRTITKNYETDVYEDAISQLDQFLKKKKIPEEQIVSYKVTKIITCKECNEILQLDSSVNYCKCGSTYDFCGNKIEAKRVDSEYALKD